MLVIAKFFGDTYTQKSGLPFTVTLIKECASATVWNPGQSITTSPANYYYSGTATFDLQPFEVSPIECRVIYSCEEPIYDLCDYSSEKT